MPISYTHKTIFIHIPKTAGCSLSECLDIPSSGIVSLRGEIQESDKRKYHVKGDWWHHLPVVKVKDILPRDVFEQYFKFTFVRNPWDRVVSLFFFTRRLPLSETCSLDFETWVKYYCQRENVYSQSDLITDGAGNFLVEFIGRYENLNHDWMRVSQRLSLPSKRLPHYNQTKRMHYSNYYDEHTKQLVGERFQEDIDRFGYSFARQHKYFHFHAKKAGKPQKYRQHHPPNHEESFKQGLFIVCMILKNKIDFLAEALQQGQVHLFSFATFVREQQISGFLYPALKSNSLVDNLPAYLVSLVQANYFNEWIMNEMLMKEIRALHQHFQAAGKDVIYMKGPFFVERFYGNIDRRKIRDIDIFARKEDVDGIHQILVQQGYGRRSKVLLGKERMLKHTHHFEYWKDNLPLDLHWAFCNKAGFALDYEKIWDARKVYTHRGKEYFVLADEYKLVLRIISIFKDIEVGNLTLKSCLDMYMLLRALGQGLDWGRFWVAREAEGLSAVSVNILDLVLSVFDCRQECPELERALQSQRHLIKCQDLSSQINLFKHSQWAIQQKQWAFGLYPQGQVKAIFDWGKSLPFRLAMHQE